MSTIKSKRKMDHLERTANNFRQEVITQAKVCGITNESETVKRLRLAIANKDFTFKAGQWVDFFIPGVSVVGGFSICSSPGLLQREGILELAVKHTAHPPAHWIHTECTLDSEVALRVGGDFFFDPQPGDSPVNLVLIAGGVGINPLFSILLHIADLHGYQEGKGNRHKLGTAKLYYSAKNTSELLFKAFPGKITCCFHVTQQRSQICEELQPHITGKYHGIVQSCYLKPKFDYILQDEVVHNNPAFLHLRVQNETPELEVLSAAVLRIPSLNLYPVLVLRLFSQDCACMGHVLKCSTGQQQPRWEVSSLAA
ncbi:hypothetical protein DUI87_18358 [Hirundo rustica rustica]|uniref:FAD-binding FR-type domain-containing protein n=1 Tax=Hirundo rustica rustica TaxID=333673 RepID=A0A3M0K1P2_HIRRU|nr:hypothetical protein DUI87_18358 [Hirundo rustica rustica]